MKGYSSNKIDREMVSGDSDVSWSSSDVVNRNRPIFSYVALMLYVSAVLFVVFFALLVRVPVKVEAVGRLASSKETVPIKAPASFVLGRLKIAENSLVKKGEVLMSSREILDVAARGKLTQFMAGVTQLVQDSRDPLSLKAQYRFSMLTQLYHSINAQGEIQALIVPINDHLRELSASVAEYNQVESSVADLRMIVRVNSEKIAKIRQRGASQVLAKEVEALETEIVGAKTKIQNRFDVIRLRIQNTKNMINSRRVELQGRIDLYEKTFNVVAPFDGMVTNLKIKGEGELVSPGDVLLELVPSGSILIALVELANEDVAKVKVGSTVAVVVDSLPELDYGSIEGRVIEVLRKEAIQAPGAPLVEKNNFQAKIELSKQTLSRDGVLAPLLLGMSVRARIISDYQTIFNAFMKNVLHFGERAGM